MGLFDRFQHHSFPISLIAHRNLFLLGIALILCGLSWSNFLMSLGQLVLAGNWILEGGFRAKWKTLKTEPLLWILCSLFLLHLIGLAWTVDFKYGFHDLGIKLPLLALPLILGTSPKLEKAEWKKLMEIYWLSCFLILCVSFGKYFGLFSSELHDKREYSVYISHIRFGLNIAFAVVSLFYYLPRYQPNIRVLLLGLTGFFIWGLFQLEMITGPKLSPACLYFSSLRF